MTDVFDMCQTLWRRIEELGAFIRYDGFLEDGSGNFHPDPHDTGDASPTIAIGRPYYVEGEWPNRHRSPGSPLPEPDLLAELVTLAHEAGHFLSWKHRTPRPAWEQYFSAAKARDAILDEVPDEGTREEYSERLRTAIRSSLSPERVELILAEEALAWAIGGELLQQVGFEAFDYYEARSRKGIHIHRYRLGLDDLWPEDIEGG